MKNVLEFLEHSAEICGKKTAVDDGGSCITYEELKLYAEKIGSGLTEYVTYGTPVPVLADKSVDTLTVFLGIVEAGCFYVPVNPVQPDFRVKQILDALDAKVLVSLPEYEDRIRGLGYTGELLFFENLKESERKPQKLSKIREQMTDTDILYAMFTSGSTGVPKGVLVSHRAVFDFIGYFTDIFEISGQDVIANQAPFDFDVSVKDIYSTLRTGATMVIVPTKMFSTPPVLLDYLCEKKATTLIWAVSALCLVSGLKALDYKVPETVKKVLFSGEAMPVKHLNLWRKHLPRTKFVNLYGPTEITCNCTYYKIDREFGEQEKIPIGRPFPNRKVFLLAEDGTKVMEAGKAGEICVAGTSLASGYFKNPEQTKKVFVQNPFQPDYEEKIYKTGDLAYYNEQGELVFCGRKDFQIKHMGHRIELEEIELAINAAEGVERGFCVFDEAKNRLAAYYVGTCDKKELRDQLKEKLPVYMVPTMMRQVDQIPMTKNGKIDRKYFLREKEAQKKAAGKEKEEAQK